MGLDALRIHCLQAGVDIDKLLAHRTGHQMAELELRPFALDHLPFDAIGCGMLLDQIKKSLRQIVRMNIDGTVAVRMIMAGVVRMGVAHVGRLKSNIKSKLRRRNTR